MSEQKENKENKEPEIYKPVNYEQYGKYYEISNYGNIRRISDNRQLLQWDNNGYMTVRFSKPGPVYQATVSRMVAFTFVPNPDPEINIRANHIDEDKHNNYYKNLEWTTQKVNVNISTKDKTHKKRVVQLDEEGDVIKVFDTVNQAAKEVGVDRTTISKVIVGVNQTAGGYKWAYEDEEKRPENREVVDLSTFKCLSCYQDNLTTYFVDRQGRVYNKSRNVFLKPCVNAKQSQYVTLPKEDAKKKNVYIQQLVATAFIPNPQKKTRVKHIDGDKNNNCVENLKWF